MLRSTVASGNTNVRISEIFQSTQGEGPYAGTPAVFVRTTGCNLRCWYCDTPYTSWQPQGEQRPWQQVMQQVTTLNVEHVVITGGEPFLQPDIVPVSHALGELGHFVAFETAGTVFRPVHSSMVVVSPKLENSTPNSGKWARRHDRDRDNPDVIQRLHSDYRCAFKFVIDQPRDCGDVAAWLARFPQIVPDDVWLMPQATDRQQLQKKTLWVRPLAEQHGFHFSPRIHIQKYGNVRGC